MKSTLALVALAGLASAAAAQDFTLSITGAPMDIDTTAGDVTFTVDIMGDASVGTHFLGGSYYLNSDSAFVTDMQWTNPSWSSFPTDGGYAGNGNYNQVIFGQLVIPNVPPFDVPAPGSELGGSLGTFQITVAGGSFGTLDLSLDSASPFTLEVVDINTGETFQSVNGNLFLNGASVNLVPAPSAMALLGLGGLVAGRRRR